MWVFFKQSNLTYSSITQKSLLSFRPLGLGQSSPISVLWTDQYPVFLQALLMKLLHKSVLALQVVQDF